MKKEVLIAAIALTSCKNLELEVPVPPSWNLDTCEPSSEEYIDLARSKQDRPPRLEPGVTAKEAHDQILQLIEESGYKVVIGHPPAYEHAVKPGASYCATTLPGHVFVTPKCAEEKGDDDVAWSRLLRHEYVHILQQKRMAESFWLMYAYGEGRLLALEGPAYSESHHTTAHFLGPDYVNDDQLRARAEYVYNLYTGVHIPKKCYMKIAPEIWKLETP